MTTIISNKLSGSECLSKIEKERIGGYEVFLVLGVFLFACLERKDKYERLK